MVGIKMKHFKIGALVYAFEADGSQNSLITPDMIEMSQSEVDNHINPTVSLEEIKVHAIQKITDFAALCRREIAGSSDHLETAGWSDKRARAMRIKLGTPEASDIDIVQHEVTKRGKNETVSELIELQLSKAQKFSIAMSNIDGMQAAAKEKINNITDVTEVPALLANLKKEAELQITTLLA